MRKHFLGVCYKGQKCADILPRFRLNIPFVTIFDHIFF